ncbi:MAG TPA: hypothetical protein VK978_01720 [Candidatus Saccharimonadales bacterium]|nr:hypothetical protein [Candidatus Saccharimonadales bacterium]
MRTRNLLLLLAVIGTALIWQTARPGQVLAAFNFFGRQPHMTYYSNETYEGMYVFEATADINYTGISQNWMTQTMTADIFISEMKKRLYSPNTINASRASAIINMMMGIDANDARYNGPSAVRWQNGVAVAKGNLATWEEWIRDYDSAGRVEWNDVFSSNEPYDWLGAVADKNILSDANMRPDMVPFRLQGESFQNEPAIVFYNPDGTSFNIIKKCANLMGEVSPLVDITPPTPTVLECDTVKVTPPEPEVNEPVTIVAKVRYSGGPPTKDLSQALLNVRHPDGWQQNVPIAASETANGMITLRSEPVPIPQTGLHTVTWSVKLNEASISCGGEARPNDSFIVMAHPFLKVNGGDVVTGSSFSTVDNGVVEPCGDAPHNSKAGIVGWNRGEAPTYAGAGGQYAVMAMGYIQDFVTDQGNGRPATSLALSNKNMQSDGGYTVDTAAGRFGGLFDKIPCIDYWGNKPSSLPALTNKGSLNGLTGQYFHEGDLTIHNTLVQHGVRLTLYVKGDVNISGDIRFQNNMAAKSTAQLPVFKLIVHGRIFIDAKVNQLDGQFVAVPDGGYENAFSTYDDPARGTISTCGEGFAVHSPTKITSNNMDAVCDRQLTVNGSFAANQILFLRTFGTLRNGQPAEVFNYTPEMWLPPSDDALDDPVYQSVSSPPPLL